MDFGVVLKLVIEKIFITLCSWSPTFFGIPINLPTILLFCVVCWCLGFIIRRILIVLND